MDEKRKEDEKEGERTGEKMKEKRGEERKYERKRRMERDRYEYLSVFIYLSLFYILQRWNKEKRG